MFDYSLKCEQAFDYTIEQAFAPRVLRNLSQAFGSFARDLREKEHEVAVRQEDLLVREAIVYRFPSQMMRARAAHRRMVARRRMTLGVVTVVMALGFLMASGPQGTAAASKVGAPKAVAIHQGDTLWGIAARFAPGSVDPRAYVDALETLNSLSGPIHPGMHLKLP